jgi:histone deacetylase HOS3
MPAPAEEPLQPPPLTAASVAREHFKKELEIHNAVDPSETEVIVILHDACYGHRYSRPRTSKLSLNTIVERPERIIATVMGISAAYVRLGGRHIGGPYAPAPNMTTGSTLPMPFRICKSSRAVSLIAPAVTQVHGTKWMAELKMMCEGAEAKLALNGKELTRPVQASGDDDQKPRPKLHEGDLYLCADSLDALEGALGGICDAVDAVFSANGPRRAFVCVRPPGHHCSDTYPSGFCWLNNVHVGISHASMTSGLTHAAIIDFDLHHGDGSQAIAWAHNAKIADLPKNAPISKKTAIGYFSLHDINSYPCEWGDEEKVRSASLCVENAHGQTIWNVHLQPWKTDAEFWELYKERYSILLDKTRSFFQFHSNRLGNLPNPIHPKAAIFISAGFDASEWESHGMQRHKVNVPTDFYARFTHDIARLADEKGLGVGGRVISVLEGGYSDRALMSGVLSHLSGLAESTGVDGVEGMSNGLSHEMTRRLGKMSLADDSHAPTQPPHQSSSIPFDTNWWSPTNLEELENLVNPPAATVAPAKKPRNTVAPTYTTPTQSFTAKIVSSPSNRRSVSASTSRLSHHPTTASRPPTPPPPDVGWATAARELCKLLVPSDRQVQSCTPEDLNAEATRVRRNRQSTVSMPVEAPIEDGKRMQLRGRKAKAPSYKSDEEDESRPASRVNRRKTIAGSASLEKDPPDRQSDISKSAAGRRLSASSTIISSIEDPKAEVNGSDNKIQQDSTSVIARHRSSSSVSVRPGSSVSTRIDPPLVKKTRAPAKPRSPSKSRAIKRMPSQPPMPRVPSAFSRPLEAVEGAPPMRNGQLAAQNAALAAKSSNLQEIDSLAAGIKKISIKLNVSSKDEQQLKEAKKKPVARAPRKPAMPKASKSSGPQNVPALPATLSSTPNGVSQPSNRTAEPPNQNASVPVSNGLVSLVRQSMILPSNASPNALPAALTSAAIPAPAAAAQPPIFLALASEPNPISVAQVPTNALPQIPTNLQLQPSTALPHPTRPETPQTARPDLPVFTSTTPIRFAGPGIANIRQAFEATSRTDITPPKMYARPTSTASVAGSGTGPAYVLKAEAQNAHDLWEVPDTPQPQPGMRGS